MARADDLYLQCVGYDIIVDVDMTNSVVRTGPYTYPAQITPLTIDWISKSQNGEIYHHIDRTTGVLHTSGTYFTPAGNIPIPPSDQKCAPVTATPKF